MWPQEKGWSPSHDWLFGWNPAEGIHITISSFWVFGCTLNCNSVNVTIFLICALLKFIFFFFYAFLYRKKYTKTRWNSCCRIMSSPSSAMILATWEPGYGNFNLNLLPCRSFPVLPHLSDSVSRRPVGCCITSVRWSSKVTRTCRRLWSWRAFV